MVQEIGHTKLRERGIDLIAADNPGSFIDDTPTAKLVRQVLGAISEFDKAMTVAKLRGARERKRREAGKCEGNGNEGRRPTSRRSLPASHGWCHLHLREQGSPMKNRKREICTSGSVRDEDGQPPHLLGRRHFLHLAAGAAALPAVPSAPALGQGTLRAITSFVGRAS
jgi:Resolvase, N terminal domain